MFKNKITFFIASKISSLVGSGSGRIMIRMATLSIIISVAVMIISLFVVTGFKNEITSKVVGFASHFKITSLSGRDVKPLSKDAAYYKELKELDFVKTISPFTNKAGVIKTSEGLRGAVLKGIGDDYDFTFLSNSLKQGRLPNLSSHDKTKEVVISKTIANEMVLSLGDKFEMMFITGEQVYRDRLEVVGIYQTSLSEFDGVTIIGDISVASRVSGFSDGQVGGFEITTDDFSQIDTRLLQIEDIVFDLADASEPVMVTPITKEYIRIFDWLSLQNTNIWIIMIIMVFVAAFSMVAMMLIILIDKSSMIGILKSMGMNNGNLQRIFLWRSSYIIARGVVIGALSALILSLIQDKFKLIKLSSDGYFIDYVPVEINYFYLCAIMLYSFVALLLLQTLPIKMISRMSPHDSIKYN